MNQFGIQSYCFRAFKDNKDVIRMLKECGVNQVELCGGVHFDWAKPALYKEVACQYKDAGIEIVSFGVEDVRGDEKSEALYFQFAKESGAKFMSVNFNVASVPGSFRMIERLAAEFDIRTAIHNHGGRHWLGSSEMLKQIFETTNDRIGLCLDTAWAIDSGEDPVAMAELFGERLYGLHIKDYVFEANRSKKETVIGEGNLKLGKLLKVLDQVKFEGYAVIEYEADVDQPVPALKKCVQILKREIAALKSSTFVAQNA